MNSKLVSFKEALQAFNKGASYTEIKKIFEKSSNCMRLLEDLDNNKQEELIGEDSSSMCSCGGNDTE